MLDLPALVKIARLLLANRDPILSTNIVDLNNSPSLPSGVATSDEVSYYYDSQSLPSGAPSYTRGYSTGKLVACVYGGGGEGTYRGYDEVGQVVRQYQRTNSVNYLVEATYTLAGGMNAETYPSVPGASDRRTVSFSYDNAARLSSLSSSATSYAPAASVSSISYAATNALTSQTYGNSLINAVTYNSRSQTTQIKLGTSSNSTSVADLNYSYGTTANNGNLQSVTYAGGGLSYTQSLTYDSLNRLSTATETNGGNTNWSQTNAYDRYGNRQINLGGGNYNLSFSSSTNRITTSGFSYDSAGNLTNDTNYTYTFDAENKIKTVDSTTAYTYDGEGQRVRKLVGENTRFVYGIGGALVAEFDGSSGNLTKEYVNGPGLITIEPTAVNSNGTRYLTSDHLGSPRVITNSSAAVAGRHDYMPFGEELGASVGGRTTGMGFSIADGSRQKFTSKERDNETGLDYFEARYYSSSQGRFTSPDEFWKDSQVSDPQSWNKYAYVRNNPIALIDPTGEKAKVTVTVDKKKKTGTITVEASFAVYAASGQGVTQEQLNNQAALIKSDVESTYSGSFTRDGITYALSTTATVKVVGSEKEAIEGGKEGTFDNIVEVGSKKLFWSGDKGGADAVSYRVKGETFDRVKTTSGAYPASNLFGHEFSHLLGSPGHAGIIKSGDVSSGDNPTPRHLTNRDFRHLFGAQTSRAVRRAKPSVEVRRALIYRNKDFVWK